MKKNIRIALADDHVMVRQGLATLLQNEPGIYIVCQSDNGKDLLEILKKEPVDIVLLDVEMPVMNGMQTLEIINSKYPETKVIMLSMHFDDLHITEFISSGARGFLSKNSDYEVVVDALFAVHEQGYYFNDKVSKALLDKLIHTKKIHPVFSDETLTDREVEVLKLACLEKTNQEIADELFLSVRTVEGHRAKIAQKTNSRNIAGMVIYAIKNGYISI